MFLPDVNVLVDAHRTESPRHDAVRRWLKGHLDARRPIRLSEASIGGFLRIVTNRRVFAIPTPVAEGVDFVNSILHRRNVSRLRPGDRNLAIFFELCRELSLSAGDIADAHHAALAIEHDCTFVTSDAAFSRFPGLTRLDPLTGALVRTTRTA